MGAALVYYWGLVLAGELGGGLMYALFVASFSSELLLVAAGVSVAELHGCGGVVLWWSSVCCHWLLLGNGFLVPKVCH